MLFYKGKLEKHYYIIYEIYHKEIKKISQQKTWPTLVLVNCLKP